MGIEFSFLAYEIRDSFFLVKENNNNLPPSLFSDLLSCFGKGPVERAEGGVFPRLTKIPLENQFFDFPGVSVAGPGKLKACHGRPLIEASSLHGREVAYQ